VFVALFKIYVNIVFCATDFASARPLVDLQIQLRQLVVMLLIQQLLLPQQRPQEAAAAVSVQILPPSQPSSRYLRVKDYRKSLFDQ
jgi:hypothetical protein